MPAIWVRAAFRAHDATRNQDIVNVFHFECDTLSSPADYAGLATDIAAHMGTPLTNILVNTSSLLDCTVTNETYPGAPVGQGVHTINAPGARVPNDTKLDPNMCALLSWHTATPKRYARGHTFCAPTIDSSDLTGNGLMLTTTAYGQAVIALSTAYTTPFSAGSTSYTPVIFSRAQVSRNATPFQFPVLRGSWDGKQHWLRKRTTGR